MGDALIRLAQSRCGFWASQFDALPWRDVAPLAREIEAAGCGSLWYRESLGREAMSQGALLLEATDELVIASGIATMWARDGIAARNGTRTLAEAHPGRFILGLGVSHPPAAQQRGATYGPPVDTVSAYLDAFDGAPVNGPIDVDTDVVLAALGPHMLELAASRTGGAHTFCVPVAHTAQARAALGNAALVVGQAVVVGYGRDAALERARAHLARYFARDSYRHNLVRLGWPEQAMDAPFDDELVDALVAIGGTDDAVARVQAHVDAGATHVAVHVVGEDATPQQVIDAIGPIAEACQKLA